ncbi:MAG TPA: hypothetical protein VGC13_18485 [Longimicrobium sp.]|uniref:hypothetical protein n=1 Tax=Longimicrobium sp. TaxID=2029185 RepID=UPI002EDAE2FD
MKIEQLRAEVRQAIRDSSARAVARDLEMSPTGLLKFVGNPGSTLYGKTLKKLIGWRERRASRGLTAPDASLVAPAVGILTREIERDLGKDEARRVRTEIADVLKAAYADREGVDAAANAALGNEESPARPVRASASVRLHP